MQEFLKNSKETKNVASKATLSFSSSAILTSSRETRSKGVMFMFGAILGDIIGSPYEFDMGNKSKDFPFFDKGCSFTDDTVMTVAVADALMQVGVDAGDGAIKDAIIDAMHTWGTKYPKAGYGARFSGWLCAESREPYNSFGNGSAMRVSAAGWVAETLEDTRRLARLSAEVTHNHPEGIKGAEAVASAIFLARQRRSKAEIKDYIIKEFDYDLSRTCDEIRPDYHHVESCQQTVPEAITAFLEGEDFEDVIRTAVSLGGDCDTLTAIAGSMAEAFYGVPAELKLKAYEYLDDALRQVLLDFEQRCHFREDVADLAEEWCQKAMLSKCERDELQRERLTHAITYAAKQHAGQYRKGTTIPYIVHPMEVLTLLTAMGADTDAMIAGVLHDTVEDTDATLEDIKALYGTEVARLVDGHSEDKSKTWKERKEAACHHAAQAPNRVKQLILADKLSNLRSIHRDYLACGEDLWSRFNAGRDQQAWYYGNMTDALAELQYDEAAKGLYWEFVSLYKDVFVTFYLDREKKAIYQANDTGETYKMTKKKPQWTAYRRSVPKQAIVIDRLYAEHLEDMWAEPYGDVLFFDLQDKHYNLYSSASRSLWISVSGNTLGFSGEDFGEECLRFHGTREYEFHYVLREEETRRLLLKLRKKYGTEAALEDIFKDAFGGDDGSVKFADFCKRNKIEFGFFSF